MNKSKLLLLTLFTVLSIRSLAQRTADYVAKFDKNVQTIVLNQLNGHVLIKEADKISDFNPETNKTDWTVTEEQIGKASPISQAVKVDAALNDPDLLKLLENTDQLSFIDNSPFIKGSINDKDVIINSANGEILFNSADKKYRVLLSQYLPAENQFLFSVIQGKELRCVLYDLKSSSDKWSTLLGTKESMMKSLTGMFSKSALTRKDYVITNGNSIYGTINNKLYKLDKESGKVYWSPDFEVSRFFLSQGGKNLIAIKNTGGLISSKQALNVLNTETGKPIWKDDIVTKYVSYLEDWGDKFLIAHSSGFNFFDYATGEKIWKKDAKGDDIKQVVSIGNDYLYIADNEMSLIDKDGKQKWKNFIEISDDKTDPVYYLDVVDNNRVFYLTGTYGNMVDYTSGKKIWKGNIKFEKERPLLYVYDEQTKSFLVYNDEKIYKFDPNAADKPEAFAKLKVKNEKALSGIELFDWGVSLTGENEVIGVNMDGSTKYQNTYKEPGEASRRLLKTGSIIGSSYLGFRGSVKNAFANLGLTVTYRNADGKEVTQTGYLLTDESRKKLTKSAAIDGAVAASLDATILARVNERFKALKQNSDYAFIFARGDANETNYLVKVRKADGVEVDKIAIDNTKPLYEIDSINDNLYYAYKNELRVFSKK